MLGKIKQYKDRPKFTQSNRLPNKRSQAFLTKWLRLVRMSEPSAAIRAALSLVLWKVAQKHNRESRIGIKSVCFITGRGRGTSKRFTIARTKIKHLAGQGKLFGLRKASW